MKGNESDADCELVISRSEAVARLKNGSSDRLVVADLLTPEQLREAVVGTLYCAINYADPAKSFGRRTRRGSRTESRDAFETDRT